MSHPWSTDRTSFALCASRNREPGPLLSTAAKRAPPSTQHNGRPSRPVARHARSRHSCAPECAPRALVERARPSESSLGQRRHPRLGRPRRLLGRLLLALAALLGAGARPLLLGLLPRRHLRVYMQCTCTGQPDAHAYACMRLGPSAAAPPAAARAPRSARTCTRYRAGPRPCRPRRPRTARARSRWPAAAAGRAR